MAYVKTTWETGDVITAEKLNNAEDGIESAQVFLITATDYNSSAKPAAPQYDIDKTFAEIRSAIDAGKMCVIRYVDAENDNRFYDYISSAYQSSDPEVPLYTISTVSALTFYATTENDTMSTVAPEAKK